MGFIYFVANSSSVFQTAEPRFEKTSFIVKHFSDAVQYQSFGFLDKNRDTVSKELVSVIEESGMQFCRNLIFNEKEDNSYEKSVATPHRVVVSASKPHVSFHARVLLICYCSFVLCQQPANKEIGSRVSVAINVLFHSSNFLAF